MGARCSKLSVCWWPPNFKSPMLGTRLRTYPRIAALCNRTLDALFLSRLWLRLLLLLLGRAPPGILGPARLFLRRCIFFLGFLLLVSAW
jgi:hypothetical protein